jgi:DNA polymerase-3 subunit gamma/tau
MSEIALYRKYRPSNFKEVLGQEQVVGVLEGALKLDNVAHAYLFAGSRGTGKTSVARIFAKALGTSESDIQEIDAASNRGIDDVRALREGVRVSPFESKYKVYIMDEVHMLSKDAFNALLKTLEEPPAHVIFILATTELEKVPDTIISRCQTFTFKKPTDHVLKNLCLDVAKKEKMNLTVDGAELIAILGDGSFRDTLGIIQKIKSISGDKTIDQAEIEKVTGSPSGTLVNSILEAIVDKNLEKALDSVREAGKEDIDMTVFLKLILVKLRFAMILRYAPTMSKDMELSPSDLTFLSSLVKRDSGMIKSETLSALLNAFAQTDRAFIKELPLELALIKISRLDELSSSQRGG